jgi:alpha-amylase
MSKVKLIFGTSNTVPSGETEILFEDVYQKAFKPFLTAIYNNPEMKPTLFYAGPLLEWLEKKHPEFHTVLAEMMSRKNIEILGGGYWDPMLPLVPAPDRVGQIEVMTTYLRKKFGKRSRGSWITSQVWEAHLASSLKASGMDYVFLSERAFPAVPSFRPESPVIAEDQGKTVVIFPVMESLTERFLKVPPEHILESLRTLETTEDREVVVSLIIDGRVLGALGNHSVCYNEKWLERFFEAVRNSRDWLECVHPGRYIRNSHVSREKMYVPGPTYDSLMRWSRQDNPGSSEQEQLRPSAFYREFLTKYRESGLLYAKMMHIEILTNQLRGDKYRKRNAKEELWRGQEHYPYWHGPTGGIYSSRLRHAAYSALIEAEKATRERGIFKSALSSVDFDMDGEKEFLYSGLNFNAYVHAVAGALFELDYLPVSRNYLATFSRYPEEYHPPATREQGYDRYPRHAFLDHILHPEDGPESFERSSYRSRSPFPGKRYHTVEVVRDQPRVTLSCRGPVNGGGDVLEIRKTYRFRRNNIEVDYLLTNLTPRSLNFPWGSEINLALSENSDLRSVLINSEESEQRGTDSRGRDNNVESWSIFDDERDVVMLFTLSEPAELWRFPVYADYRVGRELQRNYQSSFFMPCWNVELPPLGTHSYRINLRIGRLKNRS